MRVWGVGGLESWLVVGGGITGLDLVVSRDKKLDFGVIYPGLNDQTKETR